MRTKFFFFAIFTSVALKQAKQKILPMATLLFLSDVYIGNR
jgi:hypothetical protein